jgi:hypothetical protein
MKLKFTIGIILLGCSQLFIAQDSQSQTSETPRRRCGTEIPPPAWDSWFNAKVAERKAALQSGKSQPSTYVIPVIVHVIHGGQSVGVFPNISKAQVLSQIKVLNDDFAGKGLNVNKLATTGFSLVGAANTDITFCLAQYDPNGTPLTDPGIDRINYNTAGWTNPATPGSLSTFKTLMDGTIKPNSIWDPNLYFNIWVTDVNPSTYLLGYATFPGGSALPGVNSNLGGASDDGIWVWAKAFGSTGTLDPTYNKGRTASHETGHWLGLRHIGGDASNPTGDCNATDYCNDTPPQKGGYASGSNGQNYGVPVYPLHVNVCGSIYGDMFMNFMDYTDDAALSMFTPDQAGRMQTAMINGYFRNQLTASSATLCDGGVPEVQLISGINACVGQNLQVVNQTSGSGNSYIWTSNPSGGVSFIPNNTVASPTIVFNNPGSFTVTAVSMNAIGSSTTSTDLTITTCVGLASKSEKSRIFAMPNPASDQLKIKTSLEGETLHVAIFNSLGEQVLTHDFQSSKTDTFEMNVQSLPIGVYFLSADNGREKALQRIVIAR